MCEYVTALIGIIYVDGLKYKKAFITRDVLILLSYTAVRCSYISAKLHRQTFYVFGI